MRQFEPQRPSDDHATDDVVAFDIETVVADAPADGSFPPWPRHRPVAAAFLHARWRGGRTHFRFETLICEPGEERAFYEAVDRLLPSNVTSISYNGAGFDLPVLQLQSMAAFFFSGKGLYTHTHAHRFQKRHCDLADQFARYGGTRRTSLSELCDALGIPVKTEAHGGDVGALWAAGEVDTIARYVREDVVATWILWLHWAAARACDERLIAEPLADFCGWIERTPEFAHLRHFAVCRPALWARSRALALRVGEALTEAGRRVQREADERVFAA